MSRLFWGTLQVTKLYDQHNVNTIVF